MRPLSDRLGGYPGLTPQPLPGTPEHAALIADLEAATYASSTAQGIAAAMLGLMLRRGHWPVGTKVEIDGFTGDTLVSFPLPPAARRAGHRHIEVRTRDL